MRERLAVLYEDNPMASHLFIARFSKFSRNKDGSNRACLDHIRHNGHMVADHCWVHRSKAMKCLELENGDIVEFEAQIRRYAKEVEFYSGEIGLIEYGLERVRNMRITERYKHEQKMP